MQRFSLLISHSLPRPHSVPMPMPLPLPWGSYPSPCHALKPHTHTWQATNWNNNSINTLRKITQHISKRFRPLRALQLKHSRDLWHIVYRAGLLTCITYVSANLIHLHTHTETHSCGCIIDAQIFGTRHIVRRKLSLPIILWYVCKGKGGKKKRE